MRHKKKYRKLGLTTNQRKMLLRGLAVSLLEHGSIVTTKARAKELRSYVERIITKVKRENETHARRLVFKKLQNKFVVKKLFDEYKEEFVSRPGGYTRIHLLGNRRGDAAEMARISLVLDEMMATAAEPETEAEVTEDKETAKSKKSTTKKKAAPKAEGEKKAKAKPAAKKKAEAKPKAEAAPVEQADAASEDAKAE
mgnify:CR=1 FL=1